MKVHSYVSPKVRCGRSDLDRQGLYVIKPIQKGEIVSVWGGKIYTAQECEILSETNPDFATHTVSVYWDIYLGSTNPDCRDDSELINHSCQPNVAVQGQIVLVAKRDIGVGEELTFDYDTTEAWADPFSCSCGAANCRESIQGFMEIDSGRSDVERSALSWYLAAASLEGCKRVSQSQCDVLKSSVSECSGVSPSDGVRCNPSCILPFIPPPPKDSHEKRLNSWLSSKCRVQATGRSGLGVFSVSIIPANELVAVWGGIIYTLEELESLKGTFPLFRSRPYQVAEGFFLSPGNHQAIDGAEQFNHSCEPNLGVKGQILVLARRDIQAGEELVLDYETTDKELRPFACICGSAKCRKYIDGNAWKSVEFQRQNHGWFSWYLEQKIAAL